MTAAGLARRQRLDLVLVQRHLAETRERAHQLILAGAVRVDDQPATRPSQSIPPQAVVQVLISGPAYVSRGGHKLAAALDRWVIDPTGCVALDVGASTGGFTDILLQRGARCVLALDVGHGQLHYQLRTDPRVVVLEGTNVRSLTLASLPEEPDLVVADVSFISLRLALPPVFALLRPGASVVALVKPQFEAGRSRVEKGGVVRKAEVHRAVLEDLATWSAGQPWHLMDVLASPIRGPAGNAEFLSLWRTQGAPANAEAIRRAVDGVPA